MNHPLRRLPVVFGLAVLCCSVAVGQAFAQKLVKPAPGAIVRGTVTVAVLQSVVPAQGYISVYIDGHFVSATADTMDKPAPPIMLLRWDSKSPLQDTSLPESERYVKDGKRELRVDVLDAMGRVVDSISSTFTLANKVARLSPNDKVRLAYRFAHGATSSYHVNIDSELIGSSGQASSGNSPVLGDYGIRQTVEDSRRDGTALLSYQTLPDGVCYVLGQPKILNNGKTSSAVYKEMDQYGRVIQDNVLSRRSRKSQPDILIQLPTQAIKIGETWTSTEKFRLEGIGDAVTIKATSTLQDLEWEGGQECAKIRTAFTGGTGRMLFSDATPIPGQVTGSGLFYVGIKTGKLVKSIVTLNENVSLDQSASAAAEAASSAPVRGDIVDTMTGPSDRSAYGSMPPGSASPSAPSAEGSSSGMLRVTITTGLQG